MIRVTVELVPHGVEDRKEIIASARIWNDGTGTRSLGNYKFELFGKNGRKMKTSYVMKFPRLRLHVWKLILAVLKMAFED